MKKLRNHLDMLVDIACMVGVGTMLGSLIVLGLLLETSK